jgi:cytoskeletal protein CcmA (bactofilin family)
MHRKLFAALAVSVVMVAALAPPASAAQAGALRNDRRISISGGIVVASGEVINGPVVSIDGPTTINGTVNDDVYVGDGRLVIRGRVTGDVLVVRGDVLITGRVGGDVVALTGRITTEDGAQVNGSVKSRKLPDVAPGTVNGEVKKLNVGNLFSGVLVAFLIFLWIAVTVSVAVLGLLFVLVFPRAAEATATAGRRFWATLGWGALVGIVGPILAVLVMATIVGIPFGLGTLSALNVLAPLGYVASALILGRLMVKGPSTGARVGAFFVGYGILRLVALIPGFGFIIWFLVCIYGLGALTQAAWRAGRLPRDATSPEPPSAPEPRPDPARDEATVPATSATSVDETPTTPNA